MLLTNFKYYTLIVLFISFWRSKKDGPKQILGSKNLYDHSIQNGVEWGFTSTFSGFTMLLKGIEINIWHL